MLRAAARGRSLRFQVAATSPSPRVHSIDSLGGLISYRRRFGRHDSPTAEAPNFDNRQVADVAHGGADAAARPDGRIGCRKPRFDGRHANDTSDGRNPQ